MFGGGNSVPRSHNRRLRSVSPQEELLIPSVPVPPAATVGPRVRLGALFGQVKTIVKTALRGTALDRRLDVAGAQKHPTACLVRLMEACGAWPLTDTLAAAVTPSRSKKAIEAIILNNMSNNMNNNMSNNNNMNNEAGFEAVTADVIIKGISDRIIDTGANDRLAASLWASALALAYLHLLRRRFGRDPNMRQLDLVVAKGEAWIKASLESLRSYDHSAIPQILADASRFVSLPEK